MSDSSSSVCNNNSTKIRRNPKKYNQPSQNYEQKYVNQLKNGETKLKLKDLEVKQDKLMDKETVKSFMEFFESIPEYDDVNHLSNRDFYRKLDFLKEKQRTYHDYLQHSSRMDDKTVEWIEEYTKSARGSHAEEETKKKPAAAKPFCITPILIKSPKYPKHIEDVETFNPGEMNLLKPPSRRSVRIETPEESYEIPKRPKSRMQKQEEEWNEMGIELDSPRQSKSAPNSPVKFQEEQEDDGITIPKPFEMTVRDEENKIVDDLMTQQKKGKTRPKSEMFRAHPIPIESQIPLFDKIMAEQEIKNRIVREHRKAQLESQMRPFSFTRRDEEIQKLTSRLSKSSPSLFLDDPPIKIQQFKAKPIPKNLFSNYIYKKMHEDEFYRALQKKIRAEEMLRAASLPPSMAKRERTCRKYDVCPRSYRDLQESKVKTRHKIQSYKEKHDNFEKELEELTNELLGFPGFRRKPKKQKKKKSSGRASSGYSTDSRTISSADLHPINRSNLAAVLRIEAAKKRFECEMSRRIEEAKLKEEARWREKLMRKKPVWQTLAYSHEEDLAMRLQLRRDEERLRNEEHKLRMQLMLGRVEQQPTLFERQSQVKYPKTRDELLQNLYPKLRRSVSDLSDLKSSGEFKERHEESFREEQADKSQVSSSEENDTNS